MYRQIFFIFLFYGFFLNAQQVEVYTGKPQDSVISSKKRDKQQNLSPLKDRFVWMGNFGLNYFNGWIISLNPKIGFRTDSKNIFIPGIGGVFMYTEFRNYRPLMQAGPMAFVMINMTSQFFLAGEFYYLNQEDIRKLPFHYQRIWLPYTYVGGGYRSMISEHFGTTLSILYNLTPSPSSIWNRTLIQVGFISGF